MKKKRKAIFLISSLIAVSSITGTKKAEPKYSIVNQKHYATYSKGKIYIGNKRYLNSIDDLNINDILVLDQRKKIDSNMKVISSYKIRNAQDREDIIDVLLEYENTFPSNWNRTKESMIREWIIHNTLYDFNYSIDRTIDVDFNNEDEFVYSLKHRK